MKIAVFDTETSGLPSASFKPTIVQFCYIIYNVTTNTIETKANHIIRQPKGYIIPQEAINIHRITNEMCQTLGTNLHSVLEDFLDETKKCDFIVGHNVSFDINMLQIEYERMLASSTYSPMLTKYYTRKLKFLQYSVLPKLYCTMKTNIKFCGIERTNARGYKYFKFPKLSELHHKLFQTVPLGLHDAMVDVYACLRCYHKIIYNQDLLEINDEIESGMAF